MAQKASDTLIALSFNARCGIARISMGKSSHYSRVQILTVLALLFACAANAIAQAAQPTISDFRVTLLGTSTPNPLPDRFGPSTLVEAGGERLLFDCGRGATIRLWQLKIPLGTVKLFITHLHSDHTVGIPDLWLPALRRCLMDVETRPSVSMAQKALSK